MIYRSTRNGKETATASEAILKGLAPDGGLYVPDSIPSLGIGLEALSEMDYRETALLVLGRFLTDFTEEELSGCILKAYGSQFEKEQYAPVVKVGDVFHLELFHGPTIAFKDMALSILPHLMTVAAKKNGLGKELVILTATSGDTGKAALCGFADVPGIRIIVFYPKDGVSEIQKLQMVTQEGKNVAVAALHGNFDEAQTGVKRMFADKALAEALEESQMQFTSANSINIGRLIPQIVYYVYAYGQMVKSGGVSAGDTVHIAVPTGNFGNILAAWYAKQMGIPVGKLLCASNENKVLFDFFRSGTYDKNRPFFVTDSPSMDILVSSNLERLLYLASGEDAAATKARMESLSKEGAYTITEEMKVFLKDFVSGYATEVDTKKCIRKVYEETGYVMDPHTAVARSVADAYREKSGDETKIILASTASPYKFPETVLSALGSSGKEEAQSGRTASVLVEALNRVTKRDVPEAVKGLADRAVLHTLECSPQTMEETVRAVLGI